MGLGVNARLFCPCQPKTCPEGLSLLALRTTAHPTRAAQFMTLPGCLKTAGSSQSRLSTQLAVLGRVRWPSRACLTSLGWRMPS